MYCLNTPNSWSYEIFQMLRILRSCRNNIDSRENSDPTDIMPVKNNKCLRSRKNGAGQEIEPSLIVIILGPDVNLSRLW
jgi:hypothetical protein